MHPLYAFGEHRDFFRRKIGNGESFIFIDYAEGVLNVVATIFHYLFCIKKRSIPVL